jgi:hypothetical protein
MNSKLEAMLPLVAALLVLASSMWAPSTTLVISLTCFILLSLWFFWKRGA